MKKGSCPKLNFYQFQFLIFSIIFKPSSLKLNRSLQTRKLCEHFLSYVYKYPRVWIQEETDLLIQVSGYGEIRLSSYGQGHNHHTKSQLKKTSKKTPKVYVQLSGQDLMWRRESKVDLIDVLCFLTSFITSFQYWDFAVTYVQVSVQLPSLCWAVVVFGVDPLTC